MWPTQFGGMAIRAEGWPTEARKVDNGEAGRFIGVVAYGAPVNSGQIVIARRAISHAV
jgi:hypothetical protein